MFIHTLRTTGGALIVTHGGTSSPRTRDEGCREAALAGLRATSAEALAMAVEAVAALEDDGRFNAGSGSVFAADGQTIEMDAAVMDSRDRLGAVAALRDVRNPVRVARAVAGTPHWLLAGEGALRFARRVGFTDAHVISPRAPRREVTAGALERSSVARFWNFPSDPPNAVADRGCDTVGAVVRDASDAFAAAASTGGLSLKLMGRVGDTPIVGCGFYAGPGGAFAVTGVGERIVRAQLAFALHERVLAGEDLAAAMEAAIARFPDDVDVGVIGVSSDCAAVASNRDMASAFVEG